jgi:Methyltransferase domain
MNVTLETAYADFAKGFSFRFIRPEDPLTRWWLRLAAWYGRFGGTFDLLNTRFPPGSARVKAALKPVCRIPRMSTPAVGALIHRGVAEMAPGEAFVNVGVWNGFTFLSGVAGNPDRVCIGVDNFSQFGGPKEAFLARFEKFKSEKHRFHDIDYKDYFVGVHRESIGFYIYDGEHSYQNQLDGLRVAEPFFAPGCLVMVDDTNDPEPRQATADFVKASSNSYETILDVTTRQNHHPTWWNGVILLRRVG